MKTWIFILVGMWSALAWGEDFEVLPHSDSSVRGRLTVTEGLALIRAENRVPANRFTIGADLQIGPEHRFDLGWTILDTIDSGEKSNEVGAVDRDSSGPNIGYYILPDRLWLMYSFLTQYVAGSRVSDSVSTHGHQFAVGYRFYSHRNFNIGGQLSYLFVPHRTVPVLEAGTNTIDNATYPSASLWTLSVVFGVDSE